MSEHKAGYEKRDVNMKKLTLVGVSIVLFLAISLPLLNEYFLIEKEKIEYDAVLKPKSISLEELHARENSVLTSYNLIDTANGIYSIPLDSAIELYVKENMNKSK